MLTRAKSSSAWIRMRTPGSLAIVLAASISGGWGCTQRHVRHWDELAVGMDKPTVRRLLGTPTSEMGPVIGANRPATRPSELLIQAFLYNEVLDREGWVYGPPGLFGAFGNIFGPSPDAYVVYFDASGRVQGWRRPVEYVERQEREDALLREYLRLVCAGDGAAQAIDDQSWIPDAIDLPAPVPRRTSADTRGKAIFEWELPPHTPNDARFVFQIGVSAGESPANAPVAEWEPLTFMTPRTIARLDFDMPLDRDPRAYWPCARWVRRHQARGPHGNGSCLRRKRTGSGFSENESSEGT